MTDRTIRQLEKAASTGDTEAGIKLIRERIRAGTLSRDKVALAAYCGDSASLVVDGGPHADHCYRCERSGVRYEGSDPDTGALRCARCWHLPSWVEGLKRWDGAPERAALAAAWAVARYLGHGPKTTCEQCCGCHEDDCPVPLLEAAEALIPMKGHAGQLLIHAYADLWTGVPWTPNFFTASCIDGHHGQIRAAANLAGDEAVRSSIFERLCKWALKQ